MNNLTDLFEVEMKNLYALEKQSIEVFEDIKSDDKKLNKELGKIKEKSEKAFESVKTRLQKHSINPGNTVDKVASEILENLSEISSQEIDQPIKNAGLAVSLNRYLHYVMANYQAVGHLTKSLKMKKEAKICSKQLKRIEKRTKKLNKLMKKSLFEQSAE